MEKSKTHVKLGFSRVQIYVCHLPNSGKYSNSSADLLDMERGTTVKDIDYKQPV